MMVQMLEFQLVVSVAGIAAFVALWLTLRRATALMWLLFWICRGLGVAVSAVVFAERSELQWLVAGDALLLAASQVLLLQAVWRHVQPDAGWRNWRRLVWALLGVYLAAPWLAPLGALDPDGTGGPLGILFRLATLPTNALVLATLIARRKALDLVGMRLIALGMTLQIVQNAGGALVTASGHLTPTADVATSRTFVWLPILTYVSMVLGSLYLVLAESRDEIQRIAAEREKGRHMETLGRMAGGVAHDFNNVLTAIGLSAEMARMKLSPHETEEALQTVRLAVARGGDLVKSLLLFARGESMAVERFDVNGLVRELEPLLNNQAGANHQVRLALGDGPAEIMGDRSGVTRILSNLIVNARDAMADRGVITLATTVAQPSVGAATGKLILRVSDTGAGIRPEVLPRIFEPFYSTKGEGRGTGLGLTIVQTFVQKMDGEISVTSEIGRGTTIEIRLPLAV